MKKPVVYIASPYTRGDPAINTHFQCKTFDTLMNRGGVTPIVPLWSHMQHLMFPRPYQDWIQHDLELINLCDACLRLDAKVADYCETTSSGADNEVFVFEEQGKPVFYSITDLYRWVDRIWPGHQT